MSILRSIQRETKKKLQLKYERTSRPMYKERIFKHKDEKNFHPGRALCLGFNKAHAFFSPLSHFYWTTNKV